MASISVVGTQGGYDIRVDGVRLPSCCRTEFDLVTGELVVRIPATDMVINDEVIDLGAMRLFSPKKNK